MAQSISTLLHLFIDLYEKNPTKLLVFLEDDDPFDLDELNDLVPRQSQYELLHNASQEAREELQAKTLLETLDFQYRHRVLRNELNQLRSSRRTDLFYEPLADIRPDKDELKMLHKSGASFDDFLAFMAAKHGLSQREYELRLNEGWTRERLASKNLGAEVLRFFADQVDSITNAVEQFDGTNFKPLVPNHLIIPFRELHINAVLGNYGTACILCGTLLERTLQDLLPSSSPLSDLIKQAKNDGLLENSNRRYADKIQEDRNNAVHGKVEFSAITSDHAWETVICARRLISSLYKDRLIQE